MSWLDLLWVAPIVAIFVHAKLTNAAVRDWTRMEDRT